MRTRRTHSYLPSTTIRLWPQNSGEIVKEPDDAPPSSSSCYTQSLSTLTELCLPYIFLRCGALKTLLPQLRTITLLPNPPMAALTRSLQPFVSLPPPLSQVLIAHFLGFLAADNISIRSQTSRSDAQTIINILTRRIHASFNNTTVYGSDKQRLQHYIDTTYAAIYGANVRTIAVDQNIRSDDVQRIINIIGVAVQIFFGQSDALHSRAVNIWPILNLGLPPDAVDPTMVWPEQVTQHASALRNALDVLPRMALKPGLVAVSENHLDHIGNGAALLSQNLGNLYRNFQNAAQAAARNNQVVGSSSTGHNDANPLKLQDQHAGRKVGLSLDIALVAPHL
jgi:hypothetical protein